MQVQVQDVGFGYSPYPHELARDPRVSLQAKGLFAVYGSFVSVSDPTAWPSEAYLCKLCGGINPQTFRKYKRELLESGWISQVQRHRENGQYTTVLVTRYYHPSMNPFSSIKSTVDEKTVIGKTDVGKCTPQEQKPDSTTKKHTQTKPVCVPIGKGKDHSAKRNSHISSFEEECIEWIVGHHQAKGQLKNESGLRRHLVKAAMNGDLDTSEYLKHMAGRERAKKGQNEAMERIEAYRVEASADPITPDWWEQQKREHAGLFK